MKLNHNAPVIVSCQIEIEAEPSLVWDVVAGIEAWPAWDSNVKSATLDGGFQEGSSFRWRAGMSSIVSTVQNAQRPGSMAWTGKSFGIDAMHVHEFRGTRNGTVVTTTESWDGILVKLLRGPMRKMLRQSLEAYLRNLKTESERRARSRQSSLASTDASPWAPAPDSNEVLS